MNNEEKFKNKVQELLDEHYYTYDPENWQKASKHLDQEDARKRRRAILILLSGLGLGLAVLGYFLLSPTVELPGSESRMTAVAPVTVKTDNGSANAAATEGNEITSGSEKIKETPRVDSKDPVKETEPGNAQAKKEPKVRQAATISEKPEQEMAAVPVSVRNETKKKDRRNDGNNKEIPSSQKNEQNTKDLSITPPVEDQTKGEPKATAQEPGNIADVQQKETKPLDEPKAVMQQTNSPVPAKEEKQSATEPVAKKDSLAKNTNTVTLPDTMAKAVIQPTIQNLPVSNFCYIEAGAFYNFGWKNMGTKEGNSVNPYLGISYLMHLTDKVHLSVGAYYTTLSGLDNTKVVKSSKVVFGEESTVTEITPFRINYVAIPLRLHYALGSKQMFTAGYSASYMLDVQSKVHKYDLKMGTQQNESTYRSGGYVEGLRTFNSQLSLGYRRKIYGNLWANIEYLYGLTDLRDDDFFGLKLKETYSGLRISLSYDMQKK